MSREASNPATVEVTAKAEHSIRIGIGPSSVRDFASRFSYPKETWIVIGSALGIGFYLVCRYVLGVQVNYCDWALISVLMLGGAPLIFDLARKTLAGEFGSDLLAGLSIATSVFVGEYLAGCIVVLMLSGGTALEQYATRRASATLSALAKRLPNIAHRRTGSQIDDIRVEEVQPGDTVVLFPHEICPVDGVVIEGSGRMDESYLTGEPYEILKASGAEVMSGAVNGDTALTVVASRLPKDSRYARIMRVMQEAEMNRPRLRRIADRLGAWYTAFAISVAITGAVAGHDPKRFLQFWSLQHPALCY